MNSSRHGVKRMRQRAGIPKKAVKRTIDKVLQVGLSMHDVSSELRRYIEHQLDKPVNRHKNIHVRIHGNNIYYFGTRRTEEGEIESYLVTTYPIPTRLRNKFNRVERRGRIKEVEDDMYSSTYIVVRDGKIAFKDTVESSTPYVEFMSKYAHVFEDGDEVYALGGMQPFDEEFEARYGNMTRQ